MDDKLELKEVLALIDTGSKAAWGELTENQQKCIKRDFFILNRYVSSVKTNDNELQEYFVLATNEYYNKHWNELQKHPELLWQLLCMCSHETHDIMYHEWIGFKKKTSTNGVSKFLETIYPNKKIDELELLAKIMPVSEVKELAKSYGYDDKQIKKMIK